MATLQERSVSLDERFKELDGKYAPPAGAELEIKRQQVSAADANFQIMAASPASDADLLDALMEHPAAMDQEWTRRLLARHANLSEQAVKVLMQDVSLAVLRDLAANPSLSAEVLEELFEQDEDMWVWTNLAGNPSISDALTVRLAAAEELGWIGKALAKRQTLLPEVLDILVASDNGYVRKEVARRHDLSEENMGTLMDDENSFVRSAFAGNSSVLPDILNHMAHNDSDSYVRYAIALNSAASYETLEHLADDEMKVVATAVQRNRNFTNR